MDTKNGKWAKAIIELQHDNGSWGKMFHALSYPTLKYPLTTEQALRRLEILGYTVEDKPIKKAVKYMNDCLIGKNSIPDIDKTHRPWEKFIELMLSTWIRIFTKDNEKANNIAKNWSKIVNGAFANGFYDHEQYLNELEDFFGQKINPKAPRWNDFISFYTISLLTNELNKNIEPQYFKHVLEHKKGIYYVYYNELSKVPDKFQSKSTSSYIRAIELLSKYENLDCKKQLFFVKNWLNGNMINNNEWDIGKEAKDNVLFPLSDSWKNERERIKDCTYKIQKIYNDIENANCNIA